MRRLRGSAVVWSWGANGLRLASGLLLLPLVLNKLPAADLGMYYVLLSLSALVPLVDFGFGPTIGRFVSYAMGGAKAIQAQGLPQPGPSTSPNYRLLWELLFTTRKLYRLLTLVLVIVLGAWGTYMVELRINETSSPLFTRLAWVATLVSAIFDIYASWWLIYLRSLNEVLPAARIALVGILVRVVIAAALLLCGFGLLSLPIGTLFGSVLQRLAARWLCLRLLPADLAPASVDTKKHLRVIWPNTWRVGIQFLSSYLTTNANTAICLSVLGLVANGKYGLSLQLVGIVSGMATVWLSVKWPIIGQHYARHDLPAVQHVLWSRMWLQYLTFLAGAAGLLLVGPFLLQHFGSGKQMLSVPWMGLLLLNAFLEMQFILWGTLLFTENRMDYLWPTVGTNVASLGLSLILVHFTSLGLGALVLGPLLAGVVFNYWYWPAYTARRLGTTLLRFMAAGPAPKKSEPALVLE